MTPVLRRTLQTERRALAGWLAGIGLLVVVTAGSWPAVKDSSAQLETVLADLPPAFSAFLGDGIATFSAAGVVGSRLFGTVGLAAFISFAVSRGARAIAGEEQDGTLELLVTQPLSRTHLATDKLTATFLSLALLVTAQMVLLLVAMPVVGLDFAVWHVVGASVGLYLLSAMFGMLAFAVGAATGNRSLAVGVGAGTAGGLFLLGGLGALVEAFKTVADLSPFRHFDGTTVLADGVAWVPVVGFGVVAVVLAVVGVARFDGRDLS